MTSKARQKIDPQTRDMFDPEVDRPDHDKILTTLFSDEGALVSLLMELHNESPLTPFNSDSSFTVTAFRHTPKVSSLNLAQAVSMTGVQPRWDCETPIRIVNKKLEVPLEWASDDRGRYTRLIGFCDIAVMYDVVKWPSIEEVDYGKGYEWTDNSERFYVLIEVKSTWPTVGNLIRQLNLYRYTSPLGFSSARRGGLLLVGPDASMNALANEHYYRLVTFNPDGSRFQLQPKSETYVQTKKKGVGVF